MRLGFVLTILTICIIFSTAIGLILPKSIAESSEKAPLIIQKEKPSHKYYFDSETGMYKVKAGGGGARIVVTKYYPTNLEIKVGDSVKWYNPTGVPEPHTVTFVTDNNYMPLLEAPFSITDSSGLEPLPTDLNSEPVIIPLGVGEKRAIIASNARVFYPFAVDSTGNATNLGPNGNYIFDGTEKYVNSGWLLPKAFVEQIPGSSETFTVKFEKSGTFQYVCVFHPWMAGKITVIN